MNPAFASVAQYKKLFAEMVTWLDKAIAYAEAKHFDPAVLFDARLAPDQYPFMGQVLSACNIAVYGAARLAGKERPADSHPETMAELKASIAEVVAHLEGYEESDFVGWEARVVPLSFFPGKGMAGEAYLYEMLTPNVLFHATTAYAILRHNGLDLGIADFLGPLPVQDL
jgi:hypothetical protein